MQRALRTGRRPRPPAAENQTPLDAGLHHGATAPYEPIPAGQVEQLIDAALVLMRDSGVAFEPGSEGLAILRAAGCAVSADGVVRFEPDLVREALGSVAKSARLWDRDGTHALELDCRHTWFLPGMTCIKVYDLETGEPRDSSGEDLATVIRVADALANIDGCCIPCKNVTRSDIHGEIEEFSIMAANTTKPLEYLCEHAQSLGVVIEMAAAIRGGRQALFDKPYFLQIITPLPLNYHAMHTDQLIQAVRAGVPVSIGTLPIGGASTPITTAGSIVNSLATDFAAMVLGAARAPRLLRHRQLGRVLHGARHRQHRQLRPDLARGPHHVPGAPAAAAALLHRGRRLLRRAPASTRMRSRSSRPGCCRPSSAARRRSITAAHSTRD